MIRATACTDKPLAFTASPSLKGETDVDNALAYGPLESDMLLNVAQCRDALDLLRALPTACAPLAFFDPQHRGVWTA
jgi:hypothetical protein